MRLSSYVRSRIAKSTNIRSDNIKIDQGLNSLMLTKNLKSMKKLKVNVSIDKDRATVTQFSSKPATEAKTETKATAQQKQAAPAPAAQASSQPQDGKRPAAKGDAAKKENSKAEPKDAKA